jgi:hypothetical protein
MRSLSLIAVAFLSVLASLAVAASPELTCGPLPTAGQCPRLDASIVELAQRARPIATAGFSHAVARHLRGLARFSRPSKTQARQDDSQGHQGLGCSLHP